jgi:SagB-type dehydrogenase family enzyme
MIPADAPLALPLLYHLNSQAWLGDDTSLEEYLPVHYADLSCPEPPVALPPPSMSPLLGLLRRRRSCRRYERAALLRAQLAVLLFGASGLVDLFEYAPGLSMARRSAPSAGARYPLEVYVVVERVDEVPDGLYRFNVTSHSLQLQRAGSFLKSLDPLLLDQNYFDDANVVLVFAATFEPILRKYGPRGYRYILMEAGHAAQNVCLLATELGLGSVCIGGFSDVELNRFLGLDGMQRASIYAVGCGHPRSS